MESKFNKNLSNNTLSVISFRGWMAIVKRKHEVQFKLKVESTYFSVLIGFTATHESTVPSGRVGWFWSITEKSFYELSPDWTHRLATNIQHGPMAREVD